MRFFLAVFLAVAFNVSSYGQFDTLRDEMEAYRMLGADSVYDNPWRSSDPHGINGNLNLEGGPSGGGDSQRVPLYACRRVANSDFTIVVEEQVKEEAEPFVYEGYLPKKDADGEYLQDADGDVIYEDVAIRLELTVTGSTYLYLPNFDELNPLYDNKSGQYTFSRWVEDTYYDDEYQHTSTAYKCHHAQFLEDQIEDVRFAREVRERNAQ